MTRSFRQQARSCFPADPIISLMEVPATIDAMIAGGEILSEERRALPFSGNWLRSRLGRMRRR
jgi:hypothetical protein